VDSKRREFELVGLTASVAMAFVYFALSRERGLTWICGDGAAQASGRPSEFCGLFGPKVRAVVGRDSRKVTESLFRKVGKPMPADVLFLELDQRLSPLDASEAFAARESLRVGGVQAKGRLPAPSREQLEALIAFARGDNIKCRAVAGAGKTTTLLMCAAGRPGASFLLLTYQKSLQVEGAKRAPPSVEVRTYHSAAGRAYGQTVRDDEKLRELVFAPPGRPPAFDALALDEAQDMSLEYYVLVRHFLRANPRAQVFVVGDTRQSICEYKGARPEFLAEAQALYATENDEGEVRGWTAIELRESFRLTPRTAAFVNTHMYRSDVLVGSNTSLGDGLPPIYVAVKGSPAKVGEALGKVVKEALTTYSPGDVFVLAPSVRGLSAKSSPLALLVRGHLAGTPTYVSGSDDEAVDGDLVNGKLAILSYNASKGCERRCVILLLDESYFQYFERTWGECTGLPNVLTVAATRASERLVIVAHSDRTLRTIVHERLANDTELRGVAGRPKAHVPSKKFLEKTVSRSVTNVIRHLHPDVVKKAMSLLAVSQADKALAGILAELKPVRRPKKIRFGSLCESIDFIYGILGAPLAELALTGGTEFGKDFDYPRIVKSLKEVRPMTNDITEQEHAAYPSAFWENLSLAAGTSPEYRSLAEWCVLAVARHAFDDGRHHVARQILDYEWVEQEIIDAARETVVAALTGKSGTFEVGLPPTVAGRVQMVGRADFVESGGETWEFKLDRLGESQILQLACYLAMTGGGRGTLLSLLGREAKHVEVAPEDADELLLVLAEGSSYVPGKQDIHELIADFDQNLGTGAEEEEAETAEPEVNAAFGLDDLY
jgi:hypothetical protein